MLRLTIALVFAWLAFSRGGAVCAEDRIVFSDSMEGDAITRWIGNSCELAVETKTIAEGNSSLRLMDRGSNAQAYVLLSTERDRTYDIEARAYRHGRNKGQWLGKMAISIAGGAASSGDYLASSEFIARTDCWETLRCTFTAPSDRIYLILVGQNGTGDVTLFDDVRILSTGMPISQLKEGLGIKRKQLHTVMLTGTPEDIGTAWGKINREAIQEDMQRYFLEPAKNGGISTETLIDRSKRFVELAGRLAPHWLAESRAAARAAGVDEQLYVSFVANVYRGLFLGDECTSYSIAPEFALDGGIFFHKNRDNVLKKQSAFVLESRLEGVNKFIALSDASVIACMMMVNDKGLAGSADTGGLPVSRPKYRGWMNTSLLRHIAERAADCDGALRIIEDFVSKGYYAGGGSTGTHWLFVDAGGKRLEVRNNSDQVEHEYHVQKVYFSARVQSHAAKILNRTEGPIDFLTFHNVSRDPSICIKSSIGGMSVEIDRARPDVLTRAWFSMPARGLSFPLFTGCTETPLPLLNGQVFVRSQNARHGRDACERIEAAMHANQRMLEARVSALLAEGNQQEAREVLNEWVRLSADSHLATLD